jgi:hypothetical protein
MSFWEVLFRWTHIFCTCRGSLGRLPVYPEEETRACGGLAFVVSLLVGGVRGLRHETDLGKIEHDLIHTGICYIKCIQLRGDTRTN